MIEILTGLAAALVVLHTSVISPLLDTSKSVITKLSYATVPIAASCTSGEKEKVQH